MPLATLTPYCTQKNVQDFLSVSGVRLRLQDAGGDINTQYMMDAIADATETINFYLFQKYSPVHLAESNWVNRRATLLAAYVLAGRKANPFPTALAERAESTLDELEKVADGPRQVPGIPLRMRLAPVHSNVRFDPRYRFKCLRVERSTSTGTTSLEQRQDWQDAFSFEI